VLPTDFVACNRYAGGLETAGNPTITLPAGAEFTATAVLVLQNGAPLTDTAMVTWQSSSGQGFGPATDKRVRLAVFSGGSGA